MCFGGACTNATPITTVPRFPSLATQLTFRGFNISVPTPTRTDVTIRPLAESELPEAARIIRLAFSAFLGIPPDDPRWPAGADYAEPRWKADPGHPFWRPNADGKLIASNFAAHCWGSFGFFGPLTVDPAFWNQTVARQLLGPTMEIFRRWGIRHLGLFTFAQSPKHIALYQKFGFWPRDLVAVMAKEAVAAQPASPGSSLFSEASVSDRPQLLVACREVTDAIFEGLDLEREIRAISNQNLGDTNNLVWDSSKLAAFAVCHAGAGTEAGAGICYVKFAAVRPGPHAEPRFRPLASR